ncbi:type II toxin-antitoxin system VapC family toxin [Klenkia sp. PcliD-1-E]|uniref:type II toxin-antitoxin system VapC family toxin n=1 Tax=Klenkia sp. PcliD-1-E TaxID=2954492 RepID=UPI002097C9C0|nr:type II toxin-antitoxin system VapC family toxin [Klenkia sp. PcliD-1-E]MCO7218423.1 type II toxin-antitoxin system VapC family toxin [Klenkia sp. PcliD-1-E]
MPVVVLDTNVVSELMRARPDEAVVGWVRDQAPADIHTTAFTTAEVRYGLARLPRGRRRDSLLAAADEALDAFAARVLPFDRAAADHFGELVAARERAGTPIAVLDGQIAAVCRARSAVLATRNTKDFEGTGVELVDPWRHLTRR